MLPKNETDLNHHLKIVCSLSEYIRDNNLRRSIKLNMGLLYPSQF